MYGAGAFGREVLPWVRAQYPDEQLCFIVDEAEEKHVNGCPVYTFQEASGFKQYLRVVAMLAGASLAFGQTR
ncbi:hypothetical protein LOY30_09935 [Pseudomonas donghuensis]|nr:hypothetical protein LOY30_09935 [Pseudomonas donghuensis]